MDLLNYFKSEVIEVLVTLGLFVSIIFGSLCLISVLRLKYLGNNIYGSSNTSWNMAHDRSSGNLFLLEVLMFSFLGYFTLGIFPIIFFFNFNKKETDKIKLLKKENNIQKKKLFNNILWVIGYSIIILIFIIASFYLAGIFMDFAYLMILIFFVPSLLGTIWIIKYYKKNFDSIASSKPYMP